MTFEEMYASMHKDVYYRAFGIVRNAEDAKDVAQLTWLKVARALPQFRDGSSPSTWIYAIATNCARDWLRRERRKRSDVRLNVPIEYALSVCDGAPDPTAAMLSRDRGRRLQAAIRGLHGYQRATMEAYLRSDTYEEAARDLCIPIGTLKSRLFRAKADVIAAFS